MLPFLQSCCIGRSFRMSCGLWFLVKCTKSCASSWRELHQHARCVNCVGNEENLVFFCFLDAAYIVLSPRCPFDPAAAVTTHEILFQRNLLQCLNGTHLFDLEVWLPRPRHVSRRMVPWSFRDTIYFVEKVSPKKETVFFDFSVVTHRSQKGNVSPLKIRKGPFIGTPKTEKLFDACSQPACCSIKPIVRSTNIGSIHIQTSGNILLGR